MTSFPDDELLKQMGSVETDDRWLHFACGHLARQFGCSPSTVLKKIRPVFRKTDQEPVHGFVTRSARSGFGSDGQWFWESHLDPSQTGQNGADF